MPFNSEELITVFVVDDHTLFAEGTSSLLSNEPSISVVGVAKDGQDCMDKISIIEPEVVLLDISLPDTCGTDLIEKIKKVQPEVKIIMLSGQDPKGYVAKSMSKGANGYLRKDCSGNDMIQAIYKVKEGGVYYSRGLETFLNPGDIDDIELTAAKSELSSELLTSRESEILRLVSQGIQNKEIAAVLGIKVRTVEYHVSNILRKLGVSTRIEAALKMQEGGLSKG